MTSNEHGGDPQSSESSSETNPGTDASVNSDGSSCSLIVNINVASFRVPRRTSCKPGEKNYIPDDPDGLLPATLEQRYEGRIAIIALEQW